MSENSPFGHYNAWRVGPRHHSEIEEEEALLHRIIQEQAAAASSAGEAAAAAGAGGSPPYEFFHPELNVVDFSGTPLTADGPLTVTFTNASNTTINGNQYLWIFGDGSTSTLTLPGTHLYTNTGSYTVELQVTNSLLNQQRSTSKATYISASVPTVTAAFTVVTSSNTGPMTASFTNTTTNTSNTPTTTYLWTFGDGSATTDSVNAVHIYPTGSFTASLQATGSYNIASSAIFIISASVP